MPHAPVGVHQPLALDEPRDGQEHGVRVDHADGDAGVPRERAVHGVLPEDGAVDAVVRVCGDAANHVRGVDVLHVAGHLRAQALHEPRADVAQNRVPTLVRAARAHS